MIIFTSENGFYLGDRGLAGKWFMHEESIRLPLVIFDPRLDQDQHGKTRHELVLTTDIAPTILDYAGVRPPEVMQGRSLQPLVEGAQPPWREDFLYEHLFRHGKIPKNEGVRGQRWKYCRYYFGDVLHEELYDLKADPLEEDNLALNPNHEATLQTQRKRWKALVEESR